MSDQSYIEQKCESTWGPEWRVALRVLARKNMFARELLEPKGSMTVFDVDRYVGILKSQRIVPARKRGCIIEKNRITCYRGG